MRSTQRSAHVAGSRAVEMKRSRGLSGITFGVLIVRAAMAANPIYPLPLTFPGTIVPAGSAQARTIAA